MTYDPAAKYAVNELDTEYLRHGDTGYLVRIFQPEGEGPFPMLLSIHGGAWNIGDRTQGQHINRELAASGMVVAATDFRLAPSGPYPAQVQDNHFAARWLKAHARDWNGDPERLGVMGGSSGGHTALLVALRPQDERYAAIPLPGGRSLDGFDYVIACWSVLDPWSRFEFAKVTPTAGGGYGGAETKIRQTMNYFLKEEAIREGNPQEIIERRDAQQIPPVLILQGTEDMNIPLTSPQRFVPAYKEIEGEVQVEWFPGEPHGFAQRPGPAATRAIELMKQFIAAHIGAPALV